MYVHDFQLNSKIDGNPVSRLFGLKYSDGEISIVSKSEIRDKRMKNAQASIQECKKLNEEGERMIREKGGWLQLYLNTFEMDKEQTDSKEFTDFFIGQ